MPSERGFDSDYEILMANEYFEEHLVPNAIWKHRNNFKIWLLTNLIVNLSIELRFVGSQS